MKSKMNDQENLAELKQMDSLAPLANKAIWVFDKAAVARTPPAQLDQANKVFSFDCD